MARRPGRRCGSDSARIAATGGRLRRAPRSSAQIALAIILLVSAALLVSSLVRVLRVDPGFDPSGVLAFDVSTPASQYNTIEKRVQLFARIVDSRS